MSDVAAWERLIEALRNAVLVADDPESTPELLAQAADAVFAAQPTPGGPAELLPLAQESARLQGELQSRMHHWRDRLRDEAAENGQRSRALEAYLDDRGGPRFVDQQG